MAYRRVCHIPGFVLSMPGVAGQAACVGVVAGQLGLVGRVSAGWRFVRQPGASCRSRCAGIAWLICRTYRGCRGVEEYASWSESDLAASGQGMSSAGAIACRSGTACHADERVLDVLGRKAIRSVARTFADGYHSSVRRTASTYPRPPSWTWLRHPAESRSRRRWPVLAAVGLVAQGKDGRLDTVLQIELGEDTADVGLDGLFADH
jgi:hypothetical protein